jgi:PTH1 family peptidyl-tRNA hydrolase
LQSIIDHAGTAAIPRLRIGIGDKTAPDAAVSHVLGKFAATEQAALEECLERAVEAIDCAQSKGLEAAMNAFN